jgi:hypothetical protein
MPWGGHRRAVRTPRFATNIFEQRMNRKAGLRDQLE